jgi:hypothetical protein
MTREPKIPDGRRARYSLRGHLRRLARGGQLTRVALVTVVVAAIGGVTFARCSSSGITGPSEAAKGPAPSADLLGGGSGSVNQPTNETFTVPFEKDVVNECNGQLVHLSGEMHLEEYAHVLNDGGFHSHDHQIDHLKGASADGSTQYTASDEHLSSQKFSATDASITKYVYDKLIANGPQPDFFVRMRTSMKYSATNPLGSPPVPQVDVDTDCHGQCRPGENCVSACPPGGCPAIVD